MKIFGTLIKFIVCTSFVKVVVDIIASTIVIDEIAFKNSNIAVENGRKNKKIKKGRHISILFMINNIGTLEKRIDNIIKGIITNIG